MKLSIKGASKSVETYLKNDVFFQFYPSEEPQIKCLLKWDALCLPIQKDQKIGTLVFEDQNGEMLQLEPLFAKEEINYHLVHRIRQQITGKKILKFFGACLAILFIAGLVYELKKSSSV